MAVRANSGCSDTDHRANPSIVVASLLLAGCWPSRTKSWCVTPSLCIIKANGLAPTAARFALTHWSARPLARIRRRLIPLPASVPRYRPSRPRERWVRRADIEQAKGELCPDRHEQSNLESWRLPHETHADPSFLWCGLPPHTITGSFLYLRNTGVAIPPGRLAGFIKQLKERLDDIDWHGENDGGILFGADLRQRLQVAQLHGSRNAREDLGSVGQGLRRLELGFRVDN